MEGQQVQLRPCIGQQVMYVPTDSEKKAMQDSSTCNEADMLPATVVAVWGSSCVNLKVELDGEGQLWKTSANLDQEIKQGGTWHYPEAAFAQGVNEQTS